MGALRCSLLMGTVLCLACATTCHGALIAYFNNPLLPGDTQTSYPGAYRLLSSRFSLEQTLSIGSSGAGAGKAIADAVTLTKYGDVSSPNLELLQFRATTLPKVVISMLKYDPPVPLFNLTLTNVHIISNQFSMASGDSEVISTSLTYEAVKVTYYDYNGRGIATQQNVNWTFALNRQA